MTKPIAGKCPQCGALLEKKEQAAASASLPEEREYDHRGVLLPKRTRVGGIIMPQ